MERVTAQSSPGSGRHFDLVVIGTGSGNSIVDESFADWSVAIIEDGVFGGTCLNRGCIPTKMFVYPADLAYAAAHGGFLGCRHFSKANAFLESRGMRPIDWALPECVGTA